MDLRRPLSRLIVLAAILAGSCGPVAATHPLASEAGTSLTNRVAGGRIMGSGTA